MTKPINHFLEVYAPKSKDEQKFVDKHIVIKHKDRNGNDDDLFNAKNIKTIKREPEGHGYDSGKDEKVYEETDEGFEESYQELQTLKNRISTNKRKLKQLPALHSDSKKLAIQIQRDEKRHRELFDNQFKEETEENLNELSPQTYRNAANKRLDQHQALQQHVSDNRNKLGGKTREKYDQAIDSLRQKGNKLAGKADSREREETIKNVPHKLGIGGSMGKKLSKIGMKESIIDRALANFVPEINDQEQLSDAERLISLLDSTLSENNIHTLLGLFESLSEDNRIKMLMLAEDQDGINELLDFAISLKDYDGNN